jgi:archaetidylinositol phosphate synthase
VDVTAPISTHTRVNTGVLAAREKQALIWIAHRLPRWVNSDHLTLLALVAMAGAGAAFWAARSWPPALVLVVVSLAVNWFGDSLDGTLARVRNHERPRYGFYVDHVLDIAGASLLFGGMSLSGFMSPVVGMLVLAVYLLVSAEVFLATAVHGKFRMSFLSVGPTELRIILSIGALTLFSHPSVRPFGYGPFLLFDVGGVVAVLGMLLAFATSAIRTTKALYRAEPLPVVTAAAKPSAGVLPQSVPVRVVALSVLLLPGNLSAATLQPDTVRAWNAYVAATESRIGRELRSPGSFLVSDFSSEASDTRARIRRGEVVIAEMRTTAGGKAIAVPDGLISHWRGSVFLPGVSLSTLLQRLQHPSEHGPHQQDVLALRVLARAPDELKLFIRMTRSKVVTVTYDTEHVVDYRRHGAARASSRSVATKIAELEGAGTAGEREKRPGEDRGFIWRLNSYWRYEQVDGGVIVELESLTLSRTVPLGLSTVVQPIIDRVARESIGRTLESLCRTYAPARADRRFL